MSVQAPPAAIMQRFGGAVRYFAEAINLALRGLDVWAISWWRSVPHNLEVNGDPESQHLLGLAADLQYRDQLEQQLGTARLRARGLTVVVKPSGRATHVQLFPASFHVVAHYAPELVRG